MEERRPQGRKKHVIEGSATVSKKEEKIDIGGPVGNNSESYEGKQSAAHSQNIHTVSSINNENSNSGKPTMKRTVTRGSFGTIGLIVVIILLIKLLNCGGNANVSSTTTSTTNTATTSTSTVMEQAGSSVVQNSTSYGTSVTSEGNTISLEDLLSQYYAAVNNNAAVDNDTDTSTQTSHPASSLSGANEATQVNNTVASNTKRDKYTKLLGNGKDTVTIMVYMCGTDLESSYGMATSDLVEMQSAAISDKVNIIVETGGCKYWRNSIISSNSNQIYQITAGKIKTLQSNLGKKCMTDEATLAEFIQYCQTNFPANRNILIMWDHGGGSLSGYGYDELYMSRGAMALDKMYSALKTVNCKFDIIGFDACLMATLESAVISQPFADYLLGSEEAEPGTGWYYTNWLNKLSANTSIPTTDLAKIIIDDFTTTSAKSDSSAKTTLSVVDLAEFSATVPEALSAFALNTSNLIDGDNYKLVANARSSCREFSAQNRINQIDLVDFANNIGTSEAKKLSDAVQSAVKYNRTSRSMTNAYGLSTYFPYQTVSGVSNMLQIYDNIDMDSNYSDCVKNFASMVSGGQVSQYSGG